VNGVAVVPLAENYEDLTCIDEVAIDKEELFFKEYNSLSRSCGGKRRHAQQGRPQADIEF
jgi:hypothetical protein